jgi:hypothetical protein
MSPPLLRGCLQPRLALPPAASVVHQRVFCIWCDLYLTKLIYCLHLVCNSSGRRVATLGDDSDDGDDEPQNYFAGGERRYTPGNTPSLS